MGVVPGTRLGPFEIVASLGAGGMGEVYRAVDTRLGRNVAIKVLPEHLAARAAARERFEREAKAISALGHPNICTLYDIGTDGDRAYLVMELLEGETLATRLERGPLALEEALRIAIQIANGLHTAHLQGVVHRDLKPANVMLTRSGAKILDFGVAKLRDEAPETQHGATGLLPTVAPTRATPLTSQGALVGTLQYMAPEQLEGKPLDHRADIFSFGALLYEAITGKRAFDGASQASVIAAILEREPRLVSEQLPAATGGPALDRVIRRCLAKDPGERWQSALDLRSELEWIAAGSGVERGRAAVPAPPLGRRSPTWIPWATALVAGVAMFALGWVLARPAAVPAAVTRTTIELPKGTKLDTDNASIALSPDGTKLAYAAIDGGKLALWVRPLDSLTPQRLAGSEDATYPFWSPDGAHIGFFADRKLKKVPAAGGPVQSLCDVTDGRGASWGTSGVIVFAPAPYGGLWQVPASGGAAVQLTTPDDPNLTHRNPRFLPDGKRVLFYSGLNTGDEGNGVYCLDIETKEISLVLGGDSEGLWVEPGWLAFVRDGNLMAQRIDARTLRTSGEAIPIAENVQFNTFRYTGTYTFSNNGLLLYETGALQGENQLTWFDLEGKPLGKVGEPAVFWLTLVVSPDGRRAVSAVRHRDGGSDLWMYDLARGVGSRFTLGETNALMPVWSPDGREVAYCDGAGALYSKPVDGTSPPRQIYLKKGATLNCTAWHPDGSTIACVSQNANTGTDVWLVPARGGAEPTVWLATHANEGSPSFSPDGRWMTYVSDESGRQELYVASFPEARGKWLISTGGVQGGSFSADGKSIRYWDNEQKAFAVPVSPSGGGLDIGSPQPLFGGEALPVISGDFMPDGTRFLGARRDDTGTAPGLTLVTSWSTELR